MRTSLIIMCFFVWSAQGGFAQTFSFGAGAIYGDDIDQFGINSRAYINNNRHNMCVGPEFTYFFEKSENIGDEQILINLYEINVNGHYVVEPFKNLGLYGLTGVNFSREREQIFHEGTLEEDKTVRSWGWNLGAGVHYQINHQWIAFTEYDHLFSELAQNSYAFGVFFTFGKGFRVGGHETSEAHSEE
jgi:opacity protein-like surface antigen